MKMNRAALIMLGLFLIGCQHTNCPPSAGEPAKIQVFIFAGQSNMTGYPPYITHVSTDPRIVYLNDPLTGPAISFLQAYIGRHPKRTVADLQYAVGGTGIHYWTTDDFGGLGFSPYENMLNGVRQVLDNPNYSLAGLIFYQGECDASPYCLPVRTADWSDAFKGMVRDVRNAAGNPQLPVIFAQIATTSDPTNTFWDQIQQQQASVRIQNVSMVTTADLLRRDPVHLTDASYAILGPRFEAAYESIVNPGCESELTLFGTQL